jgi:hypothetical protein
MTRKRRSYSRGYMAARSNYPRAAVSPDYTRTVAPAYVRRASSKWYAAGYVRGAMDLTADLFAREMGY